MAYGDVSAARIASACKKALTAANKTVDKQTQGYRDLVEKLDELQDLAICAGTHLDPAAMITLTGADARLIARFIK
jgi:hypothetical protein